MFYILTRLYHFTLSHFGSQAPLSTLKPNVTTSAPRLSTGCWLNFTGLGLSPNYALHAELAHPLSSNLNLMISCFHAQTSYMTHEIIMTNVMLLIYQTNHDRLFESIQLFKEVLPCCSKTYFSTNLQSFGGLF